jgi:hypothetical protein
MTEESASKAAGKLEEDAIQIRQQYPARLAMLAYLQQSPNAKARGFAPETTPTDGQAERWNPALPPR